MSLFKKFKSSGNETTMLLVNPKNCCMKKIAPLFLMLLLALGAFFLNSCVKDTFSRTHSYRFYEPVYQTTAEVRANIKSGVAEPLKNPGKLAIRGQYLFINEIDKGIHVIDNSNPAQPAPVAFIAIPGNVDLAVKDNLLYADLYTDLVTIDITNPLNIQVKNIVQGVFPHRYYGTNFINDSTKIIAKWIQKDTTVTDKDALENLRNRNGIVFMDGAQFAANKASFGNSSPVGIGGSMARFTIVNNRLYTVGTTDLNVFSIAAVNPVHEAKKNVGFNIETIYPFKNKLFIGSANGMFIYDISVPSNPALQSQFSHVRSCDPVIADDLNAYVTLRSGTFCQGFTNQLEVLNITNVNTPYLVKTYPMTNPHGLSKDDNTLFICDGKGGLKVYNASNPSNLQLIKTISGIETYDVIAFDNIALVVAKDGLYQYDYANLNAIQLISKIGFVK